jgi:hypothetical protein
MLYISSLVMNPSLSKSYSLNAPEKKRGNVLFFKGDAHTTHNAVFHQCLLSKSLTLLAEILRIQLIHPENICFMQNQF